MKLEVGMYVRFNGIIRQIEEIRDDYIVFDETFFDEWAEECHILNKKEFNHIKLKVSHNIIDLIEVGDYVNGSKVINKDEEYGVIKCLNDNSYWHYEIETIVTKEQFESMSYKVGE